MKPDSCYTFQNTNFCGKEIKLISFWKMCPSEEKKKVSKAQNELFLWYLNPI